jgi:hypothetical protein
VQVIQLLARHYDRAPNDVLDQVRLDAYDHVTADYHLMCVAKARLQPVYLTSGMLSENRLVWLACAAGKRTIVGNARQRLDPGVAWLLAGNGVWNPRAAPRPPSEDDEEEDTLATAVAMDNQLNGGGPLPPKANGLSHGRSQTAPGTPQPPTPTAVSVSGMDHLTSDLPELRVESEDESANGSTFSSVAPSPRNSPAARRRLTEAPQVNASTVAAAAADQAVGGHAGASRIGGFLRRLSQRDRRTAIPTIGDTHPLAYRTASAFDTLRQAVLQVLENLEGSCRHRERNFILEVAANNLHTGFQDVKVTAEFLQIGVSNALGIRFKRVRGDPGACSRFVKHVVVTLADHDAGCLPAA